MPNRHRPSFPGIPEASPRRGPSRRGTSLQKVVPQRKEYLGDPEVFSVRVVDDRTNATDVSGVRQRFCRPDPLDRALLVRAGCESSLGAHTEPRAIPDGSCEDRCAVRSVKIDGIHRNTSGKCHLPTSPTRKARPTIRKP